MSVRSGVVLVLAALLCLTAAAQAAQRPNPHDSLDCRFCHEEDPQPGQTLATMTFWRAAWDEPKLCFRCHAPQENLHPVLVAPGPERLGTRKPGFLPLGTSESVRGQVVCTTCHFIHAPDAGFALLRGLPGVQEKVSFVGWEDLCRECHAGGLARRSPHAGDNRACAFCHSAMPVPGEPVRLTAEGDRLCHFCHRAIEPSHYTGANPYEGTPSCQTCHDPHLSKDYPARLKRGYYRSLEGTVTLNPHYRRSLCFVCHLDEENRPLRTSDWTALCNRCHSSPEIPGDIHPLGRVPPGFAIPEGWPLSRGFLSCGTCHLPGHPEDRSNPKFLRGGPYEGRNDICFGCHEPGAFSGRRPHRDADAGQGCLFCHAKSPGEGGEDKFLADVNILCFRCHDPGPHPTNRDHTLTLPRESRAWIPPVLPLGRGGRITCATCHDPHVGEGKGAKLRGVEEEGPFCSQCHRF